ncbi:MAG: ISAs1 family transposase [Saprospiraceae bacterium]
MTESGNYYCLQVKRNQPSLFDEIQRVILEQEPLDFFETSEKDHGRQSHWTVNVYNAQQSIKKNEWKGLIRFIHVHKNTIIKEREVHADRFYISSNPKTYADFYHYGILGHWSIENSLHYVKDVIHGEDSNQIRKDNGPVNSAVFSSIAINIHRKNGNQSISEGQMKFSSNVKELMIFLNQAV